MPQTTALRIHKIKRKIFNPFVSSYIFLSQFEDRAYFR
jgi:hypothetical protein